MVSDTEPEPWEETDRKRGILTQADREYLLGKKSVSGQDERNMRYRIRQRIVNSLLDIRIIVDYLSMEDMNQIANKEQIANRGILTRIIMLSYDLLIQNDTIMDPIEIFEDQVAYAVVVKTPRPEDMEQAQPKVKTEIEIEFEEKTRADLLEEIVSAAYEADMPVDTVLRNFAEELKNEVEKAAERGDVDLEEIEDESEGQLSEDEVEDIVKSVAEEKETEDS